MKKLLLVFATLFTLTAVAACNTIEGVGEDVAVAGDAVATAADKAKD